MLGNLGFFQRHSMGGGGYYEASYIEAPGTLHNNLESDPSGDVPDPFLDDPVPSAPGRSTSSYSGARR